MRFSIEKKIVLGYLPLMLVILGIALVSAHSLNELNTISRSIIEEDTLLVQAAGDMEDAILAQESYGRRYLILDSRSMLDLFRQRNREFTDLIDKVRALPGQNALPLDKLTSLHNEFNALYTEPGGDPGNIFSRPLTKEFDDRVRNKFTEISALLH